MKLKLKLIPSVYRMKTMKYKVKSNNEKNKYLIIRINLILCKLKGDRIQKKARRV